MKSCMVVYSYYPLDPRVRKQARALIEKGNSVDVICLRDEGEAAQEVVDGATICRVSFTAKKGGYLTYAYQYITFVLMSFALLSKLFLKNRYDVIHVHSLPDFQVFVAIIPKLCGKKVLLDLHEAMPEIFAARFGVGETSFRFRLAVFLEKISSLFADSVFTVNDTIKERLIARGVGPEKITVIMNSPDVALNIEKDLSEFVEKNDLKDKFVLMFIGGIDEERNIEILIESVNLLKGKLPIRLFLFGHGKEEYFQEMRNLVRSLHLEEEIQIGGWIEHEDVSSYLRLSEIGIVSYVRNPLTEVAIPNKVFEYSALSKPLIIARLNALEGLFRDAAVFYEPENVNDLVNKILQIHQDKDLADSLSKKAMEVYAGCKWEIMKERLLRAYQRLME